MKLTRSHALALFALPLLSTPAAEQLAFTPEEGSEVRITFDQVSELELTDSESSFLINGEEHGADDAPEIEVTRGFTEHLCYTEEFIKVDEDRPLEVRRTYEGIEMSSSQSVTDAEGETNDSEEERTSALDGTTVVFRWDEDEEEYARSFEEEDGDEELLELLELNGYLAEFLPDGNVAEGEDWEVDVSVFHKMLYPGGDLSYQVVGAEENEDAGADEEEDDSQEQYRDNLEGEILAEYQGTRDEDGVEVAVIAVTIEVSTTVVREEAINVNINEEQGEGTMVQTTEHSFDLEGELLWDMKAGRAVSMLLSGDNEMTLENVKEMEGGGMSIELTTTEQYEGTVEYRYTFE